MDATQLKKIRIFEDVPDEDLTVVTTFAALDEVPEGTVVVKEGDFANQFMAIEEGTARVLKGGEEVARLGPGDIFGEVSLLEKDRRAATVEATSRLRLIKIDRWELQRMKKVLPDVYRRIERVAGERREP
ncbi:MAG: cyclic nucleotide-binding domain-containing protein [Solirubrobacterales bacterium]